MAEIDDTKWRDAFPKHGRRDVGPKLETVGENVSANRLFATGATRNNDPERVDWVRMMSLSALFEYADYMRRHRKQADGALREFDNWKGQDGKGGFPKHEIVESLVRHTLDLAALESGVEPMRKCEEKEACCAIIFNAMAYLHTILAEVERTGKQVQELNEEGGGI